MIPFYKYSTDHLTRQKPWLSCPNMHYKTEKEARCSYNDGFTATLDLFLSILLMIEDGNSGSDRASWIVLHCKKAMLDIVCMLKRWKR